MEEEEGEEGGQTIATFEWTKVNEIIFVSSGAQTIDTELKTQQQGKRRRTVAKVARGIEFETRTSLAHSELKDEGAMAE